MRLKLDENLGKRCAELLSSAGRDVVTVPDEGLCSAPDRHVIEASRIERRCLVTMDMDFANPLIFRHSDYSGVAVLRLPPRPTPADLFTTLQTLVSGLNVENIEGKLWIVQPGRLREYRPEDESI